VLEVACLCYLHRIFKNFLRNHVPVFPQMVASQQPTSAGFPSSQGGDRKSSPYAPSQTAQQAMLAPNATSCKLAVETGYLFWPRVILQSVD
jgi:hypothetical protein